MFLNGSPSEMLRREADKGAGQGGMPAASGTGDGSSTGSGDAQQPSGAGAPEGNAAKSGGMSLEEAVAELERTRVALKEANKMTTAKRLRLEEFEKAELERQQAQMSDAEKAVAAQKKLQEELAARDAQIAALRQEAVRFQVQLTAQEMGLIDLDAAVRLLDADALEFDEAGKPTNVEKALKSLVAAKPYLVKPNTASPGLGTPPQRPRQPAAPGGTGERSVRRVTPL